MVRPIDGFRDSISTYGNNASKPVQDEPWWSDAGNAVSNFVLPILQGMTGGAVSTAAAKTGVPNEVSQAVTKQVTTTGVFDTDSLLTDDQKRMGLGGVAAPIAAPLIAYEYGMQGVNTAIAGTTLSLYDYSPVGIPSRMASGNNVLLNPLYRDGFQWSDIPETFRRSWGTEQQLMDRDGNPVYDSDGNPVMTLNAITAGQAATAALGRFGVNVVDSFTPGSFQKLLDEKTVEDSVRAAQDPLNTRGLLSWQSGLYSEFDIYSFQQRESAFNQGLGRWVSGTADAAIQWFAGPDVLALKLAGKLGRSLFIRSMSDLGDITKARASIETHRAFLAGEQGAKKTDLGRLLETLVKMDESQVVRHQIAKTSTDSALVARAFGSAKTYDEAADRLLAMSGDLQAIDRLFAQDKVLGDAMRLNMEQLAVMREQVDYFAQLGKNTDDKFFQQYVDRYQIQAERISQVLDDAVKENKSLETALAGINKEAGLPDAVRFGDIQISKLGFGPNSAARMAAKAVKEADRAAGTHLWKTSSYKTGGKFGRTVRVWQSAYDYMKTNRIRGVIRLNDSNDVIAEIDASLQTLPMLRQLQKQYQDEAFLPGTDMLVRDFRQNTIDKIIKARTATERAGVYQEYERTMWQALAANYNISMDEASNLVNKYQGLRQVVADVARLKGFVVDNGEVHVVEELQSRLAEGMPTMDFHFIETIFRLEQGSGISRGKDWMSIKGSRGLAAFDAIWRPLVLLRLGYTVRNVSEGNLRELAMFGTMGSFYQTGKGTRAIDENAFFRWARSTGNTVDRIGRMRYGSLRRARIKAEASQAVVRKARLEAEKLQMQEAELRDELLDLFESAGETARKQIVKEQKQAAKARVGTTWEETTTEAYGEMDAIMREAQELIVPLDAIRPLIPGVSGKRSRVVSGFDDIKAAQQDAVMRAGKTGVTDPASPLAPQSPVTAAAPLDATYDQAVGKFLSSSDRKMYAALTDLRAKGSLTNDQAAELSAIVNRATTNAAIKSMKNGDTVVRIVDPESKLFQKIHNKEDITSDDIVNGNLAVLPQENLDKIEFVRANVYGGFQDLRVNYEGGMGLDSDLINSMYLIEPSRPVIDNILRDFGLSTESRVSEGPIAYDYIDYVLHEAASNPELAQALQLRMFVNKLKQTEDGAALAERLESKGILISNAKLKSFAKKVDKDVKLKRELREKYDVDIQKLEEDLRSEEYWSTIPESSWIPEGTVVHGGDNIASGLVSDTPPFTETNVRNLQGVGFYSTVHAPTGGGYLIARFERVEKDISEGVTPRFKNPAMYVVDGGPGFETKFVDLDAPMQIMPNMSPDELMENEDLVRGIVDDMLEQVGEDLNVVGDDVWEQIDQLANEKFDDVSNPLTAGSEPYTGPLTIEFYRNAIVEYFRKNYYEYTDETFDAADYEAQMLFVEAVKGMGAYGIKHIGGGRTNNPVSHQVYIWYTPPEITPIESITSEAVRLMDMRKRLYNLERNLPQQGRDLAKMSITPWKGNSLDFSVMPERAKAILAEDMRSIGTGRTLIDDSSSPTGYRMITSPDMISISTDQVDAVLPSGLIGKDFVDQTLPFLERDALVRNPATLQSGALDDAELLQVLDGKAELIPVVRGTVEATPEQRALLARALEANDYTHIQIGAADSNKFTNVSELVGNRQTGAAYGALLGEDIVSQRRALILANSEEFSAKQLEIQDLQTKLFGAEQRMTEAEESAKRVIEKFAKRAGKRASGERTKSPLGSGEETFTGRFNEFTVDGPFNVNNQGSLNAELSSAGDTQNAMLYGFTDYALANLRKTSKPVTYTPGQKMYFNTVAEEVNKYWRNDLIGMAVIRNETDEQIMKTLFETKQGRAYLRDVQGFEAFRGKIDADLLTEDARQEMAQLIADRRNNLAEIIPDEAVRAHLIDNEVTPDYLLAQMGWRSDLPAITGSQFVDSQRGIMRSFTGRAMHILGTMPENALVRHPFFRARWRDEMQRQADLYASQGIENFSEAQLNAMNQVAKKFALKQTNETLYTIQRLSTPAHMFKFVMPFFPAWASAMRFWLLRVPVEKPENIARYAMAWNAPESAGWVYDEDGNKIEGKGTLLEKVADKAFGGSEGSIIIRPENPKLRESIKAITGGFTDFKLSKGSLDFMLQGETFWFPGLTPFVAIPSSWLAAQMPDVATAIETGKIKELPFFGKLIPQGVEDFVANNELTRPIYRAAIPFGTPTQEKDLVDVATNYLAPAFLDKILTGFKGMSSAEYAAAAKEIYRTEMTDWELSGKVGPEPEFQDSVNKAGIFYLFRGLINLTMPFATQFQTEYQFYINEGRRIDREVFERNGTYDEANKEFLRLYGPELFKYTQSLSAGGSGMSSTVGEFREYQRDPALMAQLAGIGDDASFITLATRPFAQSLNEDGFDGAVYAWQMNRETGALGKYLRGGQTTELPTTRANRELGWMEYEKTMERLNALAASRGTTVENDESLLAIKKEMEKVIGGKYREWYEDFKNIGGNRYIRSNRALQYMADSGYFEVHKDVPYAQALKEFYEGRKKFTAILVARKEAGGSANIDAKSNASVRQIYDQWIESLRMKDPTGNFSNAFDRFFQSDPLLPIPEMEGGDNG